MNAEQRRTVRAWWKLIKSCETQLEQMANKEEEKKDNMPEALQDSDAAEKLGEYEEALREAAEKAAELADMLQEIQQEPHQDLRTKLGAVGPPEQGEHHPNPADPQQLDFL